MSPKVTKVTVVLALFSLATGLFLNLLQCSFAAFTIFSLPTRKLSYSYVTPISLARTALWPPKLAQPLNPSRIMMNNLGKNSFEVFMGATLGHGHCRGNIPRTGHDGA